MQAQPLPEPPAPVEVVAVPEPLALPAQLKPLPEVDAAPAAPEPADEKGYNLVRSRPTKLAGGRWTVRCFAPHSDSLRTRG